MDLHDQGRDSDIEQAIDMIADPGISFQIEDPGPQATQEPRIRISSTREALDLFHALAGDFTSEHARATLQAIARWRHDQGFGKPLGTPAEELTITFAANSALLPLEVGILHTHYAIPHGIPRSPAERFRLAQCRLNFYAHGNHVGPLLAETADALEWVDVQSLKDPETLLSFLGMIQNTVHWMIATGLTVQARSFILAAIRISDLVNPDIRRVQGRTWLLANLAWAHAVEGDDDTAMRIADQALEFERQWPTSPSVRHTLILGLIAEVRTLIHIRRGDAKAVRFSASPTDLDEPGNGNYNSRWRRQWLGLAARVVDADKTVFPELTRFLSKTYFPDYGRSISLLLTAIAAKPELAAATCFAGVSAATRIRHMAELSHIICHCHADYPMVSTHPAYAWLKFFSGPPPSNYDWFRRLASFAELRDDHTGRHALRVGSITRSICRHMGLNERQSQEFGDAADLHDLGKMMIPATIICKPGPLTDEEFMTIKTHPIHGANLLRSDREANDRVKIDAAEYHHERMDGSGYPYGLKGSRIPLVAKVVAVADTFDAMTHQRCYAGARNIDVALDMIRDARGQLFDPKVVEAFLHLAGEGQSKITTEPEAAARCVCQSVGIPEADKLMETIQARLDRILASSRSCCRHEE
ncbi:MAG: HD-GYP domain-containing protein [Geminicoccaceae bacterium]|nr:HD-GYP domain-containing protein [Geminicoccaceae bacterium]MCB9945780.1 HD-GYP domain-containing protein [Geminicoccaceae bacterium]